MSASAFDSVKEKINEFLGKYPIIDKPLKMLADKAKVDKAIVALGITFVVILLASAFGTGHILM